MMDDMFGDVWFRVFSFPFGSYDLNTLKALEQCGFIAVSTGIRFSWKRRLFNSVGRMLHRKMLGFRTVTYFNERIPGFRLFEYPVVLNNTDRRLSSGSTTQKSSDQLLREWARIPGKIDPVGVLTHHRLNSDRDVDELIGFFQKILTLGCRGCRWEDLFHA